MRSLILPLALLALAGCAAPTAQSGDTRQQLSRAIDQDIATSLPTADSNLRAVPPGRPAPVENGAGSPRF
jgi:hypothetical protein